MQWPPVNTTTIRKTQRVVALTVAGYIIMVKILLMASNAFLNYVKSFLNDVNTNFPNSSCSQYNEHNFNKKKHHSVLFQLNYYMVEWCTRWGDVWGGVPLDTKPPRGLIVDWFTFKKPHPVVKSLSITVHKRQLLCAKVNLTSWNPMIISAKFGVLIKTSTTTFYNVCVICIKKPSVRTDKHSCPRRKRQRFSTCDHRYRKTSYTCTSLTKQRTSLNEWIKLSF